MQSLNLERFPCFNRQETLQAINRLIEFHDSLMAHHLTSASGCSLDEAISLLMYLSSYDLAEPFLLVYHTLDEADPPVAILARKIKEGPPKLPIICVVCGREIENEDELLFDFSFKLNKKFQLI
jgi:hypothetical protein